ncbi:hypothetical protein FB567DRAFT_232402 [Paraphoma chrysanthemicola]|uniref:Uncharacterized protein n=1 Tax=Paraphoma chrysanthemicola TaxID=798071 RepID=A0A8K0W2L5_9PLEO|nr:hypothetical protein FB567DRAFT_232402 [Paraphoma chrysanthemicola]
MAPHKSHDPEKYPPISQQDEEMIKQGIEKAETGLDVKDASSVSSNEGDEKPADDSTFQPNRIFYILRHNLFSKEISIIDITSLLSVPYTGREITDEFRDAARALSEDKTIAANYIYRFKAKHWYSSESTMTDSTGAHLVDWKHGAFSSSSATLTFPASSAHSSHSIVMKPPKWYKRTNEWVRDSITYAWRCDSKRKANRMTLVKTVGARQQVVGRYVQRWGSWITGGVLLVDGREEDEVIACATTCVMLRRMQQRAAERSRPGGGGGGGGE